MINATEIEAAVNSIFQDIYSADMDEYDLVFSTNGFYQSVVFFGIVLWDSEDHDIPESDSTTIEEHLRRRLREEILKLSRIKI